MMHMRKLGEVAEVVMGQAPAGSSYNNDGVGLPLVAGAGDFGEMYPEVKKYTSQPSKISQPGDIILGIRASIGEKVLSDKEYCLGRGVAGVRAADSIDGQYLWHCLEYVAPALKSKGRGATFLQVNRNDICSLEIPLPPLKEQKRIAKILDAADALRAKRRESLAQLDALLQSVFLDLFGDPVKNPKKWASDMRLGDVADIASGITKGRKVKDGEPLREVPYLAVANVQDKHLKLGVIKSIKATPREVEKYKLVKGDLLLTEGGDPDKLGRGALWDGELEYCIHQNHVFRVRAKAEKVNPVFLSWIVGSSRGKQYFMKSAKQTTGIASINMTQLRAFPMLLPPLELQNEFATIVHSIEGHREKAQGHGADLDALFLSLQQKAFSGEL